MHALFVTYDGRNGKLYSENGLDVIVANGPSELWSLRMLAASLRSQTGAEIMEVEFEKFPFQDYVSIQQVA